MEEIAALGNIANEKKIILPRAKSINMIMYE